MVQSHASLAFLVILLFGLAEYQLESERIASNLQQYRAWKLKYNIRVLSHEDHYRLKNFLNTRRQITEFNAQANHTYKQGLNRFAALTDQQFQLTYLKLSTKTAGISPIVETSQPSITLTINWIQKGIVSPVKDQGTCASCWAFSAVALLQSHARANHQQLFFSEQQLVDCSEDYGNSGCYGGFNFNALAYIKQKGIAQESQYPYKAMRGDCLFDGGNYKIHSVRSVKGCTEIYAGIALGPLAVTVDAVRWRTYSSGIFNDCDKAVNHDVLLVGLSTTFYLLKNSWGSSWGQQGYIRLALGNTCGICTEKAYYVSSE